MEMLLNEYDMVVGAKFEEGTIQDYIDDKKTFGLIRIENSTANWFLYNDLDSDEESKELYNEVIKKNHFIHDEFGEKIVLFNKSGQISYEEFVKKINDYIEDGLGQII
ncbi:hypothetical protein [Malaciobacter mytili]|uniref:Uncharacterized protein n=1 Tax=Malaciobacter mytili LMG 24559 TaxID=1032238 RepID=A0AAX2AFZ6_9BACT|nr:hypothetical protein [Malaciobacter mytili]AXH15555.1 hypothetical protein AMYT_1987 [Malaciobacter mytili LMG 24559]RXI43353.1 hypothetical protein CRU99_08015 [Malaciobacter mytili]RXK15049.1 hypothetical protein CP985_10605 [Malaciobacter mytili LMG 24559]